MGNNLSDSTMDTLILYSRTGDEIPMKKTVDAVRGATIDPPDKPYAKIIIRYRPAEILQKQGLISSSSRFSTPSSTAISISNPTRKRSLGSTSLFLTDSGRPMQRLRGMASADLTSSPHSQATSLRTSSRSQTWMAPPALTLHGASGTSAELMLVKEQLSHANNQMNVAMKQMYASMDLMNRSMRELQSLQQRIEALEATRQEQPQLLPAASLTLPPIRYQSGPTASGSSAMSPAGAAPSDGENSALQLPPLENGQEYWPQTDHELNLELSGMQWPS